MRFISACVTLLAAMTVLAGCGRPLNKYESVYERYYATTLGLSTSADVLAIIRDRELELLSQSESVVASWGTKDKKDRTHWFNMVAFDQNSALAVRKYGFVLEETTWGPNRRPTPALRLDIEEVLDKKTLEEPYPNANAMRIAVLQKAVEMLGADAREVSFDSVTLRNSAAMANQALHFALVKLTQSPAEAARLGELEGMPFDHAILGQSRIRMLVRGDVVTIKIKAGNPWLKAPFEQHLDVINM